MTVLRRVGVSGLGNRIEARRAERSAAQQAPHGEPQAAPGAVHRERFAGIRRARRREPARRWTTLGATLVPDDHADESRRRCRWCRHRGRVHEGVDSTRRSNRCTSASSCSNVCSLADGRAPMSSQPAVSPCDGATSATITRNRRRRRLRSTARPYDRATEYPTRRGDAWGSLTNRHHRVPVRKERPDRASRSKAVRPWILPIKR
jgi:hypothetical protein